MGRALGKPLSPTRLIFHCVFKRSSLYGVYSLFTLADFVFFGGNVSVSVTFYDFFMFYLFFRFVTHFTST